MLGYKLDVSMYPDMQFGSYVEASYGNIVINKMTERTHECIALGPTGNLQGSLKCFDMQTAKAVIWQTIQTILMPMCLV